MARLANSWRTPSFSERKYNTRTQTTHNERRLCVFSTTQRKKKKDNAVWRGEFGLCDLRAPVCASRRAARRPPPLSFVVRATVSDCTEGESCDWRRRSFDSRGGLTTDVPDDDDALVGESGCCWCRCCFDFVFFEDDDDDAGAALLVVEFSWSSSASTCSDLRATARRER